MFLLKITILTILLFIQPAFGKLLDRVVAIVNEDVITLSELKDAIKQLTPFTDPSPEIERQVLEELINTHLAVQEAKKRGIEIKEKEVENTIKELILQKGITLTAFKEELLKNGISYEDYKNWLKYQLIKRRLIGLEVQGKVTVTEEEIKNYYETYRKKYKGYTLFKLRHILLPFPQTLTQEKEIKKIQEKILRKLKMGVSFSELAKLYSKAPTASDGGDLGWFKEEELAPVIKETVKTLKVGEYSSWIKTDVGYQLIQLIEKKKVPEKTLSEVREEIYKILYQKKLEERYQRWLKELREKAYIKILL